MEREELDELVECEACGATISPSEDPAYPLGEEEFLCFECAIARGGEYDATEDRWIRPPRSADLPDERRAHP